MIPRMTSCLILMAWALSVVGGGGGGVGGGGGSLAGHGLKISGARVFFARSYIVRTARTARTADAPDDRIALDFDIRKTEGIIVLSFHPLNPRFRQSRSDINFCGSR